MNDCTTVRVREALPEYLHGTLDRRERLLVQAHLAGCDECSSELALLERCRLVMAAVPTVDTLRIIASLPAPRVRHRPRADHAVIAIPLPTGWHGDRRRTAWRVAAAALLTVGAMGVVMGRGGHWPVVAGAVAGRVDGLARRSSTPAVIVRPGDSAMLAVVTGETLSLGGGLSDLSDEALNALLGEVDAMEALPLVEPPTVGAFVVTEPTGSEQAGTD